METKHNSSNSFHEQAACGVQADQIALEQGLVDRAYATLDGLREFYRVQQAKVAASSQVAHHASRSRRDALAAHYGDQAARLEQVENRLVFGKLTLDSGERRYIGRVGLRNDEDFSVSSVGGGSVDVSGSQLLLDWRAPAARAFYQATAKSHLGVLQRRHILTQLRQVVGVEDELLNLQDLSRQVSVVDGGAVGDGTYVGGAVLQGEGALMAAMSAPRSGRMTDIVSTIQAQQDEIIRGPLNEFLVVQGGPGTGKTAVALHRAAYLLYSYRERLERSGVLVVGPSRLFLRYIERVLPALGESGVVTMTLGEAFPGVRTVAEVDGSVRALKGELWWLDLCRAALERMRRPLVEDVYLRVGPKTLCLSALCVGSAMGAALELGETHNESWVIFATRCIDSLVDQFVDDTRDKEEVAWAREQIRSASCVRRAINRCWLPGSATEVLGRIYAYPSLLAGLAPGLSSEQLDSLYRPKHAPFTASDVPILDELAQLLGPVPARVGQELVSEDRDSWQLEYAQEAIDSQNLGDGLVTAQMLVQRAGSVEDLSPLSQRARRDREWTYGHVVVDEAQELTDMDWHLLLRKCPSLSFTVVGDIDQCSVPLRSADWQEALGPARRADPVIKTLTVNYRTPGAVMDFAQRVMRANGRPVCEILTCARHISDSLDCSVFEPGSFGDDDLRKLVARERSVLDRLVGSEQGRICLVTLTPEDYLNLQGSAVQDSDDPLSSPIVVLKPFQIKGLEFDTVMVFNPAHIAEENLGDLYVCLTRPTQRLHVISTQGSAGLALGMQVDSC